MPESCRICGEPMAPAARMTSRRASSRSPVTSSIPVARGPASPASTAIRRTCAPVRTARLGRCMTGRRYAFVPLQRRPARWFIWK